MRQVVLLHSDRCDKWSELAEWLARLLEQLARELGHLGWKLGQTWSEFEVDRSRAWTSMQSHGRSRSTLAMQKPEASDVRNRDPPRRT
jgi:hypothetical protein